MEEAAGTRASAEMLQVRFWASARAAAGTDHVDLPVSGPLTLADLVVALVERAESPAQQRQLEQVLGVCSVLVGDQPHGRGDRQVVVRPGDHVEFLPPFAGG